MIFWCNADTFETALQQCESPIEKSYLQVISSQFQHVKNLGYKLAVQFPVDPYRLDFAFVHEDGRKLCVELDGHDFHERTAVQATHDRQRDRAMMLQGWRVIRFTGMEIHHNTSACVKETLLHLEFEAPYTKIKNAFVVKIASEIIRLNTRSAGLKLKRSIERKIKDDEMREQARRLRAALDASEND